MIINKARMTLQKKEILNFLRSTKIHPTAEEVYLNVKHKLPKITLATVYRNLNLLAENNSILRFEIKGGFHFDFDISKHQHFVCDSCGIIYDVYQEEVSNYALNNIKGFSPNGVQIIYKGICNKCQGDKYE